MEPIGVRIVFGAKPPKNWKENLKKQKDETYQTMRRKRDQEEDPVKFDQLDKELQNYWAKRREELGFKEPQEA